MTLQSFDPATGELVGEVPMTPPEDMPHVVEQARQAQPAWSALGLSGRRERLEPLGSRLVEKADELGHLLTREMGKPLREAVGEVKSCGSGLSAKLDEIVAALEPDRVEDEHAASTVHHDPLGVCACIAPWNFPVAMPHWLVVPALVAGNTVVLKPSELTPLVAQAYADLVMDLLPKNVLQVVHGDERQGKALVAAKVSLVAFTGSREAGKNILSAAGGGLKRVILELGGKDPLIVLDDADIEAASTFAARNSFRNAGQVCVSTERIYVDETIADEFERAVVEQALAMKVGSGLEDGTDVGPMISPTQRDHVLAQIDDAIQHGAKVAAGGEGHHDQFVMPTVLTGVDHGMNIMRDETFGPVACIMRVSSPEQAVELANDTPFGLGASVFGKDEERAAGVARQLGAGMIGVNRGVGGASGTPWVGANESGYGFHGSKEGHRQFTQARVLTRPKKNA